MCLFGQTTTSEYGNAGARRFGASNVPTPRQYREFALDCLCWAEQAKDAGQRQSLVALARLWMQTASDMDRGVTAGGTDGPHRFTNGVPTR